MKFWFDFKTRYLIIFKLISASRIRYEITRGNFGGAFAVKNMTGAIYVAGQLDYETRKRVRIFFEFFYEIKNCIVHIRK